jgi:hypothetical protein
MRLSWIPLDCDDEFDDPEVEGFFIRLLKTLGRCGGRLPADISRLTKALHLDVRKVRRLWAEVKDRFIVAGEWVRHRIVDEAIERLEKARLRPDFGPKCPRNPRKTNEPAANRDNPMSPQERSHRESPPDVREDAPAAAPASIPLRSRKRGKGKQRPKPQPAKRRSWPPKVATSPLPDDWMPSPAGIAFAHSKGLTDVQIRHELDVFAFHHRKLDSRFADWGAAWCGWVLRAPKFAQHNRRDRAAERAEQRAESTRRSDEAIFRAAQRSAARHGAGDCGWSQTIAGNAAG